MNSNLDMGTSEELLISLMKFLKKYLMDDSVKIINIASQTLRVSSFNQKVACEELHNTDYVYCDFHICASCNN